MTDHPEGLEPAELIEDPASPDIDVPRSIPLTTIWVVRSDDPLHRWRLSLATEDMAMAASVYQSMLDNPDYLIVAISTAAIPLQRYSTYGG